MESYIIYQAKRYDVKERQCLKTLEKYYMVDVRLRNAMLGSTGTTDVDPMANYDGIKKINALDYLMGNNEL